MYCTYLTIYSGNKLPPFYILKGWNLGRLTKPIPPLQKGKIWINNGLKSKMIQPNEEIENGWTKGRIYSRK